MLATVFLKVLGNACPVKKGRMRKGKWKEKEERKKPKEEQAEEQRRLGCFEELM